MSTADFPTTTDASADPTPGTTSGYVPTATPAARTPEEIRAEIDRLQAELSTSSPADPSASSMQAPPPSSAPAATDPTEPSAPAASDTSSPTFAAGDQVTHTYRDDYRGAGGEDVTDFGLVVEVVTVDLGDGATAERPRVAWLRDVSDPIDPDALRAAK